MANEKGIKGNFDTNGSPLAVPISPNPNPTTTAAINIQGNSKLHFEYSAIGIPMAPGERSPYTNAGHNMTSYTVPRPSTMGQAANQHQGETNRYSNNSPEQRSF